MADRYLTILPDYRSGALDKGKLGPAMTALNPRQRGVVDWLVTNGSSDFNTAAEAAGYMKDSISGFRVQVYRLRHDPKVNEAIVEEGKRRVAHELPSFLRTIVAIGTDPTHKDALKAALAGAAMSGVSPISVSKSEHEHRVIVDDRQAIEQGLLMLPPEIAAQLRAAMLPPMIDITPSPARPGQSDEKLPDPEEDETDYSDISELW